MLCCAQLSYPSCRERGTGREGMKGGRGREREREKEEERKRVNR